MSGKCAARKAHTHTHCHTHLHCLWDLQMKPVSFVRCTFAAAAELGMMFHPKDSLVLNQTRDCELKAKTQLDDVTCLMLELY